MGCVCSCFGPRDLEDNQDRSIRTNRTSPSAFIPNLLNKYAQILGTRQVRTIWCGASSNFTVGLDDTVSNTGGFCPRSLPCNANPRCSNLQLGGRTTCHEKGPCHLLKDSESLRRSNIQAGLELVSGGGTLNRSHCEGGSRKCHSESSVELSTAEVASRVEYISLSSEDEDVCPICFEEYTPENPKIVAQCSHHFHLGCIYEWLERSQTCAVCSTSMVFDETS